MDFSRILKVLKLDNQWRTVHVVDRVVRWRDGPDEVITFFLKENKKGKRKYTFHSYGLSKCFDKHTAFEAEMKLWVETGLVPKGAQNVLVKKLSK